MQVKWELNPSNAVVDAFYQKARGLDTVAFDVETNNLDPYQYDLLLVQFGLPTGDCVMFDRAVPAKLVSLLSEVEVVGHNLKFDIKWAKHKLNARFERVYDTMLAEASIELGRKLRMSLKAVALRRLGIKLHKEVRSGFIGRPKGTPFTEEELQYGATDVIILYPIKDKQAKDIQRLKLEKVVALENDTCITTAIMELRGIDFDRQKWQALTEEREPQLLEVVESIYARHPNKKPVHFGLFVDTRSKIEAYVDALNLASPQQNVTDLRAMGYPIEDTRNITLKWLAPHSWFAQSLLDFRENHKLLNAFLWSMFDHINPVTGRIHPEYKQLSSWGGGYDGGTATGRYSCSNPNFQQMPRLGALRECFIAPAGYKMVTIDWSSQELREAGNLSNEPVLIDFFLGNSRTTDYHGHMANQVFGEPLEDVASNVDGQENEVKKKDIRHAAKTTNYSLIYNVSQWGLAKQLLTMDDENPDKYTPRQWVALMNQRYEEKVVECEGILNAYTRTLTKLMPTLDRYDRIGNQSMKISDQTIGRIRFFDRGTPDWKIGRQARNFPIQGNNANQMKLALNRVRETLTEVNIVGTVHDEGLFLVKEDRIEIDVPAIKQVMIDSATEILPGPIPYEVGMSVLDHWTK